MHESSGRSSDHANARAASTYSADFTTEGGRERSKRISDTDCVCQVLLKRQAMPSQSWLRIDVRAETLTLALRPLR
jgi:hypothetical protein